MFPFCRLDQVVLRTVQQIKLNKQVKNANPVIEAGDLDIRPGGRSKIGQKRKDRIFRI